jgi:hypothetical protein
LALAPLVRWVLGDAIKTNPDENSIT